MLCLSREAGLVKLGRVALDGTKLVAAASRHKAMSYDRLGPRTKDLEGEEAAKDARPPTKAQRNFTDTESRMMKINEGFQSRYNAQAVVEEESQVIVFEVVTNQSADVNQLFDMITRTEDNLAVTGIRGEPDVLLADAGHCSEDNLARAASEGIDVLIATGRIRRGERVPPAPRVPIPKDSTEREKMARRLPTEAGRFDYARRKAIVEPVFSQVKARQRAGFLRLRGLDGAQGEWTLHTLCHNLRKLEKVSGQVPVVGRSSPTGPSAGPSARSWVHQDRATSFKRRFRPIGRY
jgi:hypothetical protein